MKLITFISCGLYIVLAACAMQKENKTAKTPLFDTKWSLKKIYEGSRMEIVDNKAFLRFNKEKNSAGGNGSCNSFGSTLSIEGDEIRLKDIFSPKMYCEEVQKTENAYLRKLALVSRYEIKKDTLFLYEKDTLLLEFQPLPDDIKQGT